MKTTVQTQIVIQGEIDNCVLTINTHNDILVGNITIAANEVEDFCTELRAALRTLAQCTKK